MGIKICIREINTCTWIIDGKHRLRRSNIFTHPYVALISNLILKYTQSHFSKDTWMTVNRLSYTSWEWIKYTDPTKQTVKSIVFVSVCAASRFCHIFRGLEDVYFLFIAAFTVLRRSVHWSSYRATQPQALGNSGLGSAYHPLSAPCPRETEKYKVDPKLTACLE